MGEKLDKIASGIIFFFSILFLSLCTLMSLMFTFTVENLNILSDNSFLTIVCVIVVCAVIYFINIILVKLYKKHTAYEYAHLFVTIILVCGTAFVVLRGMNQSPQSDALAVYNIAKNFSKNDYGAYTSTGSYLALFPFQTSFVFVMEMIMRVTGKVGYILFQYMNICYFFLIVLSGYGIIKCQKGSRYTIFPYFVLITTCIPIYFYIPNIYGDIPHVALMLFALWMFCLAQECSKTTGKVMAFVVGCCSCALAVMYKGNSWILVVALVLCVGVNIMNVFQWQQVLGAALLLMTIVVGSALPDYIYENKTGRDCGTGIPTSAVLAMGMQESNGVCGGWNGFHSTTFEETGYNYDETLRISQESIVESIERFKNEPSYFWEFYRNKMIVQWAEQEFSSFYTLMMVRERTRAAWTESVLFGEVRGIILEIMDIHQSVVYVFALFFVVYTSVAKKDLGFGNKVLLVTFIGGFLFTIIWEAGARMALPYFIMLIPVAGQGIGDIQCLFCKEERA
ncbi:MAG: hypothetical protein IJ324_09395 [Lachnospiraceae bacterium]|nr:hypothetical protein [Lachnospiraceae bacterium]